VTDRLQERLDAIYAIGGGHGANRPAYSPAEDEAHALVAGWMSEAGLVVERDPAGNLVGRLAGWRPHLPEVWTGSHLDSVPAGGRFDGPLGVLAGLEAVEGLGRQERTLVVVAFRDEEGWRFGRGCFGSRALCGRLEPRELDALDAEGVSLRAALGTKPPAGGWLPSVAAYVEVHIEQGPVLAALDAPLGVVTSIVGLARLSVVFRGRAGHAGTTPMVGREDALMAASRFVLAVNDAAVGLCRPDSSGSRGAVATVGKLTVEPGAANVVPDRAVALVDARAPGEETLGTLLAAIEAAADGGSVERLRRTSPVPMSAPVCDALHAAIRDLGLDAPDLHSGAGHDAGPLGAAGVPVGMLFVRSRNGGVSHAPDEWSDPEDVALAVKALAGALRRLAGGPGPE
jgi:hydantoinase/carbamoylase family amidase